MNIFKKPVAYLAILGMTYGCHHSIDIGSKRFDKYPFKGKEYNIVLTTYDGIPEILIRPSTNSVNGSFSYQDSNRDGKCDYFKFDGDTTGLGSLENASLKDLKNLEETLLKSMPRIRN